jgi:glutamine amidotransferase
MCRFLVYRGSGMFMADLLTRSDHSLITQSFRAWEREEPLNGDGFGVGWYTPDIDPIPCVFTSLTPAWSNRNLRRLAEKISAPCFFAHVRAATSGLEVAESNCHPFQHGRYLWMHNGHIADFRRIKRRLRESLDDDLYEVIRGTTDAEHAFALYLQELGREPMAPCAADCLYDAMLRTLRRLTEWLGEAGVSEPSYFNFAVSDGNAVLATRYVTQADARPQSLYYAVGERFVVQDGAYRMLPARDHPQAVIIASEPLSAVREGWLEVPPNHAVLATPDLDVTLQPISV